MSMRTKIDEKEAGVALRDEIIRQWVIPILIIHAELNWTQRRWEWINLGCTNMQIWGNFDFHVYLYAITVVICIIDTITSFTPCLVNSSV